MKFPEFGEVIEEETGFPEFGEVIDEPSKTRSILGAFPKGLIREAGKINPMGSLGPIPGKMKEKLLEQFLPTREGGAEDILEFAGEMAPAAVLGEGGLVKKGLQSLLGGVAKKGAKELDLPEWAQDIVGTAGMVAPGALKSGVSKTLKPSSKQESIFNFLKSKGLTDKEITPIIQNPKKLDWLSKGAYKFEKDNPLIKGMNEKGKEIYSGIRSEGKKFGYLEGQALKDFEKDFYKTFEDLPDLHKDLIKKPIENLMNKPIDFSSLMDFKMAINHAIKDVKGGKSVVGMLKGPTKRAQAKLSPSLFAEQELADKTYQSIKNFSKKMTKNEWEGLIKLGTTGKIIMGAVLANPGLILTGLEGAASIAVGRYALRQLLVNPRYQNMRKKIQEHVLKNEMSKALKLAELMKKELQDKVEKEESPSQKQFQK